MELEGIVRLGDPVGGAREVGGGGGDVGLWYIRREEKLVSVLGEAHEHPCVVRLLKWANFAQRCWGHDLILLRCDGYDCESIRFGFLVVREDYVSSVR